MSASLHGDVASAIGQQVEQMILQAQKDSEGRVRHDLNMARSQLQQMEGVIGDITDRVGRSARANGAGAMDVSQTVDRAYLNQKIAQLEQKWGSEVKALKQDLHRTILAHNHNSDLMRHHRDALDEARRKLDAQTQPKAEQVDTQIEKVDRMLRAGQAKQRALEALTDRLAALEQQVEILPSAGMPGYPGMPGMMPGLGGMSMPPGMEREVAAAAKRQQKKDEPPNDEEIRARLMGAQAKANAAETAFNAEAPVFVPRGANSPTDVAAGAPIKLAAPAGLETGLDAEDSEGVATDDAAEEQGEEAEATTA
jgi:hypothetical protein